MGRGRSNASAIHFAFTIFDQAIWLFSTSSFCDAFSFFFTLLQSIIYNQTIIYKVYT